MKCNKFSQTSLKFRFLFSQNATNLERFQLAISKREMYHENSKIVDNLVQDMVDLPIQHVGEFWWCFKLISKKSFPKSLNTSTNKCQIILFRILTCSSLKACWMNHQLTDRGEFSLITTETSSCICQSDYSETNVIWKPHQVNLALISLKVFTWKSAFN